MMDLKAIEIVEELNRTLQTYLKEIVKLKHEIIELTARLNELDDINEYTI